MFDRLRLLFAKGTQGVCGGVEEIGVGFQQWCVAGSQARREDRVARLLVAMQSLDQENPPNTSAVVEFVGGICRKAQCVKFNDRSIHEFLVNSEASTGNQKAKRSASNDHRQPG